MVLSPCFRHPHYRKRPLAKPRGTKHLEFCLLRTFLFPSAASVLSTPRSTALEKSRPNGKSFGTKLHLFLTYPESVELDKTRRESHHQVFKDRRNIVHGRLSKTSPRKRARFLATQPHCHRAHGAEEFHAVAQRPRREGTGGRGKAKRAPERRGNGT